MLYDIPDSAGEVTVIPPVTTVAVGIVTDSVGGARGEQIDIAFVGRFWVFIRFPSLFITDGAVITVLEPSLSRRIKGLPETVQTGNVKVIISNIIVLKS